MEANLTINSDDDIIDCVPASLKDWMEERILITAVFIVVSELRIKPESEFRAAELPFSPQVIIALLTYCYATGIYSSEEIQRLSQETEDEGVNIILGNETITLNVILSFRREWRHVIKKCLYEVFKIAWSYRQLSLDTCEDLSLSHLIHNPIQPSPSVLKGFHLEADRRLGEAIRIDSEEGDV